MSEQGLMTTSGKEAVSGVVKRDPSIVDNMGNQDGFDLLLQQQKICNRHFNINFLINLCVIGAAIYVSGFA
jgi:hypothetical protein